MRSIPYLILIMFLPGLTACNLDDAEFVPPSSNTPSSCTPDYTDVRVWPSSPSTGSMGGGIVWATINSCAGNNRPMALRAGWKQTAFISGTLSPMNIMNKCSGPVWRENGSTRIADTWGEFIDASTNLINPIAALPTKVWTGIKLNTVTSEFDAASDHCNNWTNSQMINDGNIGNAGASNTIRFDNGKENCLNTNAVLCVSYQL